ncbi:hypothetical protein AVEN_219695-1 [Araneus ventricosus]|uniref:Uncharacterized protein n=1 Tax=Araneus ventricosus TaxID=182803 RepID=A0A4Y2A2V4_ARAVE|nr:hypothetical protein AVEN_219695-1 [Araneus ventricosus]
MVNTYWRPLCALPLREGLRKSSSVQERIARSGSSILAIGSKPQVFESERTRSKAPVGLTHESANATQSPSLLHLLDHSGLGLCLGFWVDGFLVRNPIPLKMCLVFGPVAR